jgi:hypothetical protein
MLFCTPLSMSLYDKLWGSLVCPVPAPFSPCSLHVSHLMFIVLYWTFLWRPLLHLYLVGSYSVWSQTPSIAPCIALFSRGPTRPVNGQVESLVSSSIYSSFLSTSRLAEGTVPLGFFYHNDNVLQWAKGHILLVQLDLHV